MLREDIVLRIENAVPRMPEFRFAHPLNWQLRKGENWAVVGSNGSGKTLFSHILQRKIALKDGCVEVADNRPLSEMVKQITFTDIYSMADSRTSYYQQRWHATENEEQPTVSELLTSLYDAPHTRQLLEKFNLTDIADKKVIYLSSGELRKFSIIKSLATAPSVLILDNPYIGLDQKSREILNTLLWDMSASGHLQLILLVSDPYDIPSMITHILPVENKKIGEPMSWNNDPRMLSQLLYATDTATLPLKFPIHIQSRSDYEETLSFDNVSIRYGKREILKSFSWKVFNGEKWMLSGENGSGKSTLLSLIYADNPQSYANNFSLFGKKRGTGESIWDIKKRIGYVSPEMHLYYMENVPAENIVASGFFDSIGLYNKCTPEQKEAALVWMKIFNIDHLRGRLFLTLSLGEQRILLLARVFVKNPDLLLLDEPMHGLDPIVKKRAIAVIDTFCREPGKTLVYVTHFKNEIPSCVNKMIELRKNR